ncbi:hypothetical protein PENTCL1PPCAC_7620, partial [Pristionchus entomophagus]
MRRTTISSVVGYLLLPLPREPIQSSSFRFLLFSFLLLIALVATIMDSSVKDQSICESREFTGFAFVFMVFSTIVECLTVLVLVGWCACGSHTGETHRDQPIWFIILFTAVVVR